MKRTSYAKFLGVILDENILWKEHLKYTENKIAKSIGLIYKYKPFLDNDSLLSLYFSYIHSYINYANLSWAGAHKSKLKKILSQQNHVLRIVYNKDRYYLTNELLSSCTVSNVYQLNLLNTSIFIHEIKNETRLAAFHTTFKGLLTHIQHVSQAQIIANQKLGYAKVGSRYLSEFQLYRIVLLLIQRKNLNLALFLNQKS